jgi:hypothetical protein
LIETTIRELIIDRQRIRELLAANGIDPDALSAWGVQV